MLNHPTIDQMHTLGLHAMAKAFIDFEANPEVKNLTHAEWLGMLLEHEASARRQKRLHSRLRFAKLRHDACIEDVDYKSARGLDRALFTKLAESTFIDERSNLIITGPAGVGKSWLACALGHKAARDNRSVLYKRIPRMFADLALTRGDGRHARLLKSLGRVDLLICDDWGLEPLDASMRRDLLEILDDRHGRKSTIVTSQLPVDSWHKFIAEPTYADAILDRLVHNAHRIPLQGESLRKKLSKPTAK